MNELIYIRCDGANEDFIENCRLLDMDLDARVGRVIKRDKYARFYCLDEYYQNNGYYNEKTGI